MAWWLVRRTATSALRAENLTLIGRGLSKLSSVIEMEDMWDSWFSRDSAEFVKYAINCQKNTGIVGKAIAVFFYHDKFDGCSIDTKLKVLSKVFDRIRNYPQADPYEVFLMKLYLKSMRIDDSRYELTREEVSARVLDVIQSYPKVGRHYKVTEETHFGNDLGFEDYDYKQVHKALFLEFKLYIYGRHVMGSCKHSIDCIYRKQKKRDKFEEFREKLIDGNIFLPCPHV